MRHRKNWAAFNYYKGELAKVNITKLGRFVAVIHALQTQECAQRKRDLEAKREAERKAKSKTPPKCGIIRGNEQESEKGGVRTRRETSLKRRFGGCIPPKPGQPQPPL